MEIHIYLHNFCFRGHICMIFVSRHRFSGSGKHMVTFLFTLVAILNAIPPYGGFKTAKSVKSDNKKFPVIKFVTNIGLKLKEANGYSFKCNGRHIERHSAIWRLKKTTKSAKSSYKRCVFIATGIKM